ncbi:MAG: OmpA family protein [Bacteroidia bacterium]
MRHGFLGLFCAFFLGMGQNLYLRPIASTYLRAVEGEYLPPPPITFSTSSQPYRNPKLLKAILAADKKQDLYALDSLLALYVPHFSPKNFQDTADLAWIWRWGQLREYFGDTTRALFLYSLAIKNLHAAVSQIRFRYDALRKKWRSDWVPLDYYHKIVKLRRKMDTLAPPKGVLMSLGNRINSSYPDYAPYMHPSGDALIFTSRRERVITAIDPDRLRNEDLYFAQRDYIHGGFTHARKFRDIINSSFNEGSACLNSDGMLLIFVRCDAPDGYGSCDLYQAEYVDGRWTRVKNLGPTVNSPYWDSHPFLAPGDTILFFASNRPDGFGQSDIYMSFRQKDGSWSPPHNLGPIINTAADEVTPHFHPVNNTLYFSSTGHLLNFGGYDIFKSRRGPHSWEEPRNAGPLINTPGDEYYFTIDGKGQKIYYARASPDNRRDFDLYSFELPMEARPDAITKLSGYLIDSVSQRPLVSVIVAIDLTAGTEITPVFSNEEGYFEFRLVRDRQYQLMVLDTHLVVLPEYLTLEDDTTFTLILASLGQKRIYTLENLEFPTNSAEITPDAYPRLEYIAEFLRKHPYVKLTIRGHTDASGDPAYNLSLSKQRAENIRRYLLQRSGLAADQIRAEGYGMERPLFPNTTEANRARNRRVEFVVEVPPDKVAQLRWELILGTDWEMDTLDTQEIPLDPEFQKVPSPIEEEEEEWESTSSEFDPPVLPDREDEEEDEEN